MQSLPIVLQNQRCHGTETLPVCCYIACDTSKLTVITFPAFASRGILQSNTCRHLACVCRKSATRPAKLATLVSEALATAQARAKIQRESSASLTAVPPVHGSLTSAATQRSRPVMRNRSRGVPIRR